MTRMGFFGRIREGLARTTQQIVARFDEIVSRADAPERRTRPIDVDSIDALEELLISADVGVAATERIIAAVRTKPRHDASLRDLVKAELRAVFADDRRSRRRTGTRRTWSLDRRRQRHRQDDHRRQAREPAEAEGQSPLDLRGRHVPRGGRRAARDLGEARRRGFRPRAAKDPIPRRSSSTRITSGKARGRDADSRRHGRPSAHAREPDERAREDPPRRRAGSAGAPHEVLLVLDATVGQNGLAQAREFMSVAGVNGIVLTKLDGTAKGGVAVAIAHDLRCRSATSASAKASTTSCRSRRTSTSTRCSRRSGEWTTRALMRARARAWPSAAAARPVRIPWWAPSSSTPTVSSSARAHHERAGEPHAEVHALDAAGRAARGRDALLHARALQPHRPHRTVRRAHRRGRHRARGRGRWTIRILSSRGRGFAICATHGVDVDVGLMAARRRAPERSRSSPAIRQRRPFVIAKAGVSLDGASRAAPGMRTAITWPERRAHGAAAARRGRRHRGRLGDGARGRSAADACATSIASGR